MADEMTEGVVAVTHPGYAAYRREAEAMGDTVMSPEEWSKRQKKPKEQGLLDAVKAAIAKVVK